MSTWHECAIAGCVVLLGLEMLMCPRHWRKVPGELKVAVMRARRAYEKATFDTLLETLAAMREAQAAAVASVAVPS